MSAPAFTQLTDLAAERLGGKAIYCTDDFFAEMHNLLKPGRGIFIPDKYTDRGKWMDGWESRRKRTPGHDWCVIKLATTGVIHGVDIDTNHFLGNHPPFASIEAVNIPDEAGADFEKLEWKEILSKVPLEPGSQHFFEIKDRGSYSHVRLHIYPDGGVARLKIYGEVVKDWNGIDKNELIDLAAALNGARPVVCNDMFFSHMSNLIMPGRGINMGDGWETKRNRTAGNRDWVIIRLAHRGIIEKVVIDTCHFKGNYPDSFLLETCDISLADENKIIDAEGIWTTLIPKTNLSADCEHYYEKELASKTEATHARLNIFPDGGVSRMRLFGKIVV